MQNTARSSELKTYSGFENLLKMIIPSHSNHLREILLHSTLHRLFWPEDYSFKRGFQNEKLTLMISGRLPPRGGCSAPPTPPPPPLPPAPAWPPPPPPSSSIKALSSFQRFHLEKRSHICLNDVWNHGNVFAAMPHDIYTIKCLIAHLWIYNNYSVWFWPTLYY